MSLATGTPRHKTYVTLRMRDRMRELRGAGLGTAAIAAVIALDFDLPVHPSQSCVDDHAPHPRPRERFTGFGLAKPGAGEHFRKAGRS